MAEARNGANETKRPNDQDLFVLRQNEVLGAEVEAEAVAGHGVKERERRRGNFENLIK